MTSPEIVDLGDDIPESFQTAAPIAPPKPQPRIQRKDTPPDREPPHSLEAEEHVLACCLLDEGDTLTKAQESRLSPCSFYSPANRLIFEALCKLQADKQPIGIDTLAEFLKSSRQLAAIGGMAHLMQLSGRVPTTAFAGSMIETVKKKEQLRDLIKVATGAVEQGYLAGDDVQSLLDETLHQFEEVATNKSHVTELAECQFDASKEIPKPAAIYMARGTTICTPGNLTCFYSQAKAGKTAIIGAMIGAAAGLPGSVADTLGFSGANTKGLCLLHFDTEQSRYDWQQMVKTSMKRASLPKPPEWFRSYCLTGKTAPECFRLMQAAVKKAVKDFGGIYAIFIDGIGDFCTDVNDPAESNILVASLHAMAIKHDTAIINVLHMNAGSESEKGRGHLGSQLERKCESNITLEKKDDVTSYWGIRQRGKMIAKDGAPSFRWSDEAGMHVSCEALPPAPKPGRKSALDIDDFKDALPKPGQPPMPLAQIERAVKQISDIPRSTLRNLLDKAALAGMFVRTYDPKAGYSFARPL